MASRPSMVTTCTPRPYGMVDFRAVVTAASSIIDANVSGWSTAPPYRARAQRTRSEAVVAIDPAPPDAVTTDVNGITVVPSDTSTPFCLGFRLMKRYPWAIGPRGFSTHWYVV